MGRKCSVYNCRTGYDSQRGESKITVYSFPKDTEERKAWITSLPYKLTIDEVTQYMGVCALHFPCDVPLIRRGSHLVPAVPPSIFKDVPQSCIPISSNKKRPTKKPRSECRAVVDEMAAFREADKFQNGTFLPILKEGKLRNYHLYSKQTDMADQELINVEEEKQSSIAIASLADVTNAYSKRQSISITKKEWTDEMGAPSKDDERIAVIADVVSLKNLSGYFGENLEFDDFYETQHYTLICRISDKFFESIKHVMAHRAVGVAFEGQNLGCGGTLSLIQVATDSEVFIFDMIRLGNEAFEAGLQALLESEHLIKVIHDCRWIADLLRYQHQISMANVFDTQVANAFVHRNLSGGKWPSNVENLPSCLKRYLDLPTQDLNFAQVREHYCEGNEQVWLMRPLPSELLDAATDSVIHLLRLQLVLLAEMLVEFKAAVDIYLNHRTGTEEDVNTCKATSHLLPIAITYIHTAMREKAQRRNTVTTQNLNGDSFVPDQSPIFNSATLALEQQDKQIVLGTQNSNKTHRIPSQAMKRQNCSPRILSRPSSKNWEGGSYRELCKEASDGGSLSASEMERTNACKEQDFDNLSKGAELSLNLPSEAVTVNLNLATKRPSTKKSPTEAQRKSAPSPKCRSYKECLLPRHLQCNVCQKRFSSATALDYHKPTHSDQRLFKCDVCKKSFKTPGSLYGHKRIHSGKRPHMCDICGKCFFFRTALRKHLVCHSGERSYFKCDICSKSYTNLRGLRLHKIVHTGQRPYKCDTCLKSFTSQGYLSQHKKIHTGYKPYKCSICEKTFSRVYHRDMHYKSVHAQDKAYPCKLCSKRFVDLGNLNYHMRLHEGHKPYKCPLCDKTFTFPAYRDMHYKKSHCEQKVYRCTVCCLQFEGMSALISHKRTHTEDKPYKCPACDKTFKRNDNRNSHYKRIHSITDIILAKVTS